MRQLRIESIAAGGDGIGRVDGLVVFVPRTAPDDTVTVNFVPKGRFARGVIRSVDVPSPQRVDPLCSHYTMDGCGGCQIQHLEYNSQLDQKRAIIGDALLRIGKRNVEAPEVESSPKQWEYRTKLTLAIRTAGARRIAGLHRYYDPGQVFELRECPISDKRVVDTWLEIGKWLHLLPDDDPSMRGSVRVTDEGASFILLGAREWLHQNEFAKAMQSLLAIWWEPLEARRRIVADRRAFSDPFASFAQVNLSVAVRLREHVLRLASANNPKQVVDGYAGSGSTSMALAQQGSAVTAIEIDRDASNWTASHLPSGSRAINARVEDVLASLLPADIVLLNPPRSGLDEQVTGILQGAAEKPAKIIYTSCNPATLARDLARMPDYRIESLRAFDMFPQTAHVETVCSLVPEAA